MRIIAVANQKGGCGKTTTSINLAASLAFLRKKILLIDLDPQGHSTCGLGIRPESQSASIYDLLSPRLSASISLEKLILNVEPNLHLIPSYEILFGLEEELAHLPNREKFLKQGLDRIEREYADFDYVVLDCPPNLGVLTYNALEAADDIIVPIEPSFFALHGLAKISETLKSLNQSRTVPLNIHALLTIFDSRTCFAKEVYEEVKNHFQNSLFKTIIHESVLFKEAAGAGQSIVQYDQNSSAFKDYFNLAVEYLEREWDRILPAKELGWKQVLEDYYGPKKVSGGILFQAFSKNARVIEIAGDFNNWIPEPMVQRNPEGLWQIVMPITRGTYRYKFIVDGEWQLDPYHPVQQMNAFGTFDSFLELV